MNARTFYSAFAGQRPESELQKSSKRYRIDGVIASLRNARVRAAFDHRILDLMKDDRERRLADNLIGPGLYIGVGFSERAARLREQLFGLEYPRLIDLEGRFFAALERVFGLHAPTFDRETLRDAFVCHPDVLQFVIAFDDSALPATEIAWARWAGEFSIVHMPSHASEILQKAA
jgi:hypothetical protein